MASGCVRPAVRYFRCAATLMLLVLPAGSSRGQDAVRISCLPEKAIALPGETVAVNAWVASASGPITRNVAVRWVVSAGQIDEQSVAARWRLEGAGVDRRHTASVEVSVAGKPAGSCSLNVWVAPEAAGSVRVRGEYITRRAFLRNGQIAESGFGLYSYFLMREPANAADQARAASFVDAFLEVIVAVSDLENYIERRRLNGSYMPVTANPPAGLTPEERKAWAVEHYDYEQATRLLSLYPTLTGPGPFIIAVPAPLRAPIKPMLPWDFSQFESKAIAEGVSRFVNQAAQLYDWQDQGALQKLREQLLTTVAGMFVGRAAAQDWLQIIR